MKDKDLESSIHDYFKNETPEPNQQILNDLRNKMNEINTKPPKKSFNKLRLVFVTCILMLLIVPAITLPFVLHDSPQSDGDNTESSEEIYYSESNLTMRDCTTEMLSSVLVGKFSKYSTLLEDYTINISRGYFSEKNVLVCLNIDMTKNNIPFTKVKLNIVFVENYVHEYVKYFDGVNDFIQYEECKVYETIYKNDFIKTYYNLLEFEDYKVYLQLDKQDSSIINTIIQN